MSLGVAVAFGVSAALVYGTSIVVQHRSAHTGTGESDARHLLTLIRDPMWVFAILGDGIGFVLMICALSAGPVVVVQPLAVLMLPVALLVSRLTGGPKARLGEYLGCTGIIGGLALFLCLIGRPATEHVPHARHIGVVILIVFAVGVILCLAVIGRNATIRGATFGAVAGAYFGTVAVMIDAESDRISERGLSAAVTTPRGLVPLAGIVLLGLSGIVLTQLSFQVAALGASLPANIATDPTVAVILGSVLLHERFPLSPLHVIAYVACLGAVVAGAIRLAAPATAPPGEPEHPQPEPQPASAAAAPGGRRAPAPRTSPRPMRH